jgi:transcription elongation GreA/GreB family factor
MPLESGACCDKSRGTAGTLTTPQRAYLQIGDCFDKEEVETMSVAFTREESAETAAEVELPDRPISAHPNLVTESGLVALANAMAEWRAAYNAAQQIEDAGERRRAVAVASREMRYFADRLRTAEVVPPPAEYGVIAFGHQVTFTRDDGRRQAFRIVGEDEADPRNGSISYVSPVARALIGKAAGDVVVVGDHEIEILSIA